MKNSKLITEAGERTQIVVAVNFQDRVGQDGDWQEGADGAEAINNARAGLAKCGMDDLDELISEYAIIHLNAEELQTIDDRDWHNLICQWQTSRSNRWTSDEADALMNAEIDRRNAE